MSDAAWDNAVHAVLPSLFIEDLARAVSNTGEADAGARWLLGFVSDYLRGAGTKNGPIAAFDFAAWDIEAIGALWPVVARAVVQYREAGIDGADAPAMLARFLVERLPAIWDGPTWCRHAATTRALVIADRVDTLVGMFIAGLRPNGSKDPYALRRAAKHLLMQVMFPVTRSLAA